MRRPLESLLVALVSHGGKGYPTKHFPGLCGANDDESAERLMMRGRVARRRGNGIETVRYLHEQVRVGPLIATGADR